MTQERRNPVDGFVWVQWVLASGLGGAVGFALAEAVLHILSEALSNAMTEIAIFGLIGAAMGTLQWLVLRRNLAQAGWWVAASAVGGTLFGIGGASFGSEVQIHLAILYGLMGIILGALQWLVLRRQVSRSGWWMVGSLLGWALAVQVVQFVDRFELMRGLPETIGLIIGSGLIGTVVGMVTGGLLVWLLRKSRPSNSLESR